MFFVCSFLVLRNACCDVASIQPSVAPIDLSGIKMCAMHHILGVCNCGIPRLDPPSPNIRTVDCWQRVRLGVSLYNS